MSNPKHCLFVPARPRRVRTGARALLLALSVLGLVAGRAGAYTSYDPGPRGMVRVARPTIQWPFTAPEMSGVPVVTMTVNGKEVPAVYDDARGAVRYTPAEPLPPDRYTVQCEIRYDGFKPLKQEWMFIVRDDARPAPPEPSDVQKKLCETVNAYRRQAGLPELRLNPALCAAAAAHAGYLDTNRATDHTENSQMPGYTGATPQERALAFGFPDMCNEDLHCGATAPEDAVRRLFDAPYHRELCLRPGPVEFGAAFQKDRTVLLFGDPKSQEPVVYPADGERDVPLAWEGPESPDPLVVHGAKCPVGYIVTFFAPTPDRSDIHATRCTLATEAGGEVPVYVNKLTTDPLLPNGVFLIPKAPLEPQTTYVASVSATGPHGEDISRTWRFTTAAAPPAPVEALQTASAPPATKPIDATPAPTAAAAAEPAHKGPETTLINLEMGRHPFYTAGKVRLFLDIKNCNADGFTNVEVRILDASGAEVSRRSIQLRAGQTESVEYNATVRSGCVEVRTPDAPMNNDAPRYAIDFGPPKKDS